MKILINGASGMVGQKLYKLFPNAHCPSSMELALTNPTTIKNYMESHSFEYVVHLAAYVGSLHDNIANQTLYFNKIF